MKAKLPLLMKVTWIRVLYNDYFAWLIPIGSLMTIVLSTYSAILKSHGGIFTFVLDDPYIHMAMAKNVVEVGVWGINPTNFSSSSSSLLYTLLLSFLFLCFGVKAAIPLWTNLVASLILIGLIELILKEQHLPPWFRCICEEVLIFAIPLSTVIFTGMEHTIHALLNLWLVYAVGCDLGQKSSNIFIPILHRKSLTGNKPYFSFIRNTTTSIRVTILIAAILTTSTRYEGIFVILICTGLYLLKGRWINAFIICLGGFLPIIVYGIISQSFGWYFFPNSVISKGNVISIVDLLTHPIEFLQLIQIRFLEFVNYYLLSIPIFLITGFGIILSCRKRRFWAPFSIIYIVLIFSALLHSIFGRFWSLYRYEAYITVLAYTLLGIITRHLISQRDYPNYPLYLAILHRISVYLQQHGINFLKKQHQSLSEVISVVRKVFIYSILILFVSTTTLLRFPEGIISITYVPQSSTNIYDQQYQMAQFLRLYFPGEKIAINDIGAIGFYSEVEIFDLAGLGTDGVLENANLGGNFRTRLYEMVEEAGIQFAVTYPTWFSGPWLAIGSWRISNNLVCGYHTVVFWAVNTSRALELLAALQAYQPSLPDTVQVEYFL